MYTLFVWAPNDEPGGYGICKSDEFSYSYGGILPNGWRCRPSVRLGNFSSEKELMDLLVKDDPIVFSTEDKCNRIVKELLKHHNIKL